jgi:hypothetical protein
MKLETKKQIDFSSNADFDGFDATISSSDMHKLWDMLQNPYKNNIGAVVREYVSNSFDSHAEAKFIKENTLEAIRKEFSIYATTSDADLLILKKYLAFFNDDAVTVSIAKDEAGWYWSTEDFGIGLSPDRVKDVFVSYLKSTKELSNNAIGAFGLGSKSGLSYSDAFFIRTRYNGLEYLYMLRKGENGPRLDIIEDATPTTERNGTQIKIYLENSNDIYPFQKECRVQLAYFDNVFFSDGCNIRNDFEIIKGDTWITTTGETPWAELHMCIGKVAYPIDWKILELTPIYFPCALQFGIGELDIIQTREDVKYTPKTKEAIHKKLAEFKQELEDRWNSVPKEYTNLKDFYEVRDEVPCLKFDNGSIVFNLGNLGFTDNGYYYKPFKDANLPSKNLPYRFSNCFFEYTVAGHFTERFQAANYDPGTYLIDGALQSFRGIFRVKEDTDAKKSRFLQQKYKINTLYFIRKKKFVSLKTYISQLNLKKTPKDTWRSQITAFQKELQKCVIANTISYDKEVITQEYLDSIKKVRGVRDNSVVNVKYYSWSTASWYPTGNNNTAKKTIADLEDINTLTVVGTENDRTDLSRICVAFQMLFGKHLQHLEIAPTNLKKINFKNALTKEGFMKGDNQEFKSIMSALKVYKSYKKEIDFISKTIKEGNKLNTIQGFSPTLYKIITKRIGIVKNINELVSLDSRWSGSKNFFTDICYKLAENNNFWDLELEADLTELISCFKSLKVLDLFNYSKIEHNRSGDFNPLIEVVADYCYTQALVNPNFPKVPLSVHWKMYFREKYGVIKKSKAVEKQQVVKEIENLLV